MAYLAPAEFVTKMVDAGESKLLMSTRDTLIRAYMAGAILALAAAFAITVNVNTGTAIELESGLGLRRSQAAALIAYRAKNGKFKTIADLKKVPAIDFARVEARKDRIVF